MKNLKSYLILFSLILFLVIGCKKAEDAITDPGNNSTTSSDTSEVAEAIAKSLVSKDAGYGFAGLVTTACKKSNNVPGPESPLSSFVDTSFAVADSGLYAAYSYSANLKIKFIFKGQEKDVYSPLYDTAKINFKAYGSAKTTGGRLSYIDTSFLGETYISGLAVTGSTVKLNGAFYYYGNFALKTVETKNFTVQAAYVFSNLTVSKSDYKITGGVLSISVTAAYPSNNKTYTFNGAVTFLGNKQATLQIGTKQWTISWESGNIQLVG